MHIEWEDIDSDAVVREELVAAGISKRLILEDARLWGLLRLQDGRSILVGYAGVGLKPSAQICEEHLVIGIEGVVASYDLSQLQLVYTFEMPTIFHNFISRTYPLVVMDEVGFLSIANDGTALWTFLVDGPIEKFSFANGAISGKTIDGTDFCFRLPM